MSMRSAGAAAFFLAAAFAHAQAPLDDVVSALRDKALVLDLTAKVVNADADAPWAAESSKVTIPGRPVTIKLVGTNVVVAAQFTPYIKSDGSIILVAQGQIWAGTPETGVLYHTTMQTMILGYGERVYFFPLGKSKDDSRATIEVQVEIYPYGSEEAERDDEGQEGSAPPPAGGDKPPTTTIPAAPADPGAAPAAKQDPAPGSVPPPPAPAQR